MRFKCHQVKWTFAYLQIRVATPKRCTSVYVHDVFRISCQHMQVRPKESGKNMYTLGHPFWNEHEVERLLLTKRSEVYWWNSKRLRGCDTISSMVLQIPRRFYIRLSMKRWLCGQNYHCPWQDSGGFENWRPVYRVENFSPMHFVFVI